VVNLKTLTAEDWFRIGDYLVLAGMAFDLAIQVLLYVASPHNTLTFARMTADVFWPIALISTILARRAASRVAKTWREIAETRKAQVDVVMHINEENHRRFVRWANSLSETGLPPEDDQPSVH
jgi:hypothetical protein